MNCPKEFEIYHESYEGIGDERRRTMIDLHFRNVNLRIELR